MARLREVPVVFRNMGFIPFVRKVWFEINDDNLYTWAASLAYSWLFAIFPFFVFLLTLIPLLREDWKHDAVRRINSAVDTLPAETQHVLHEYLHPKLKSLLFDPPPGLKGILSIGLLVTVWAASGGIATTMAALNKCYDVEDNRPFIKQRPLAVLLTLIVASLILAVIILMPIGTLVTKWLEARAVMVWEKVHASSQPSTVPTAAKAMLHPFWIIVWEIFRYSVGLLLMVMVVAIVYHFGPRIKRRRFRALTPGSVFTVTMWIFFGLVFRLYVDKFGKYGQTYGAVGGVAVLLFIFYLDALILLAGAEIDSEIDNAMRDLTGKPTPPPKEGATKAAP